MVNFLELFLEQVEKSVIYHFTSQKECVEVYFIQTKNHHLLCIDKSNDKILYKIPSPIYVGIVNDTDFIINLNNNPSNQSSNLFFSQKNLSK